MTLKTRPSCRGPDQHRIRLQRAAGESSPDDPAVRRAFEGQQPAGRGRREGQVVLGEPAGGGPVCRGRRSQGCGVEGGARRPRTGCPAPERCGVGAKRRSSSAFLKRIDIPSSGFGTIVGSGRARRPVRDRSRNSQLSPPSYRPGRTRAQLEPLGRRRPDPSMVKTAPREWALTEFANHRGASGVLAEWKRRPGSPGRRSGTGRPARSRAGFPLNFRVSFPSDRATPVAAAGASSRKAAVEPRTSIRSLSRSRRRGRSPLIGGMPAPQVADLVAADGRAETRVRPGNGRVGDDDVVHGRLPIVVNVLVRG